MKTFFALVFALLLCPIVSAQTIRAGTSVIITISGVPQEEMTRFNGVKYPVSDAGMVNMPFIGQVRAAGLTGAQLQNVLQSAYQRGGYYTSPTFQVISDSVGSEVDMLTVMVGGDVRKTGPVVYQQGLTLWGAVQAAGGPTEFGSIKRVRLFRGGQSKTYDLTKAQFMNIPLEPRDTIDVPRKTIFGN